MKIVSSADLHMTTARPLNRTDNYEETVLRKFEEILTFTKANDAILTVSGDLFDTSKMSKVTYALTNKIIQMIRLMQVRVLATHGQHDMVYHSPNLQPSPYYTLLVGGAIEIPGGQNAGVQIDNVKFYSAGWGQEIALPANKVPGVKHILLLHRTITEGEPPFFLEDAISAEETIKVLSTYDYILSGDYHVPYVVSEGDTTLVNCGPMLRQKINERDLKPRVYLIDTETNIIEPHFLTIEEDVWNDDKLDKQALHETSIEAGELLKAMQRTDDRPDYYNVLDTVLKETGEEEFKELVDKVIVQAKKNLEGVK